MQAVVLFWAYARRSAAGSTRRLLRILRSIVRDFLAQYIVVQAEYDKSLKDWKWRTLARTEGVGRYHSGRNLATVISLPSRPTKVSVYTILCVDVSCLLFAASCHRCFAFNTRQLLRRRVRNARPRSRTKLGRRAESPSVFLLSRFLSTH